MRQAIFTLLLIGPGMALQACSSSGSPFDAVAWERAVNATEFTSTAGTSERLAEGRAGNLPLGEPRSAEAYVALALTRNPLIRAGEARVRRLAAREPQARSLDDPMLMISPIGEMAETAAGQVVVRSALSQKIPLPAKRDARGQIARLGAAQAEASLGELRLRVAGDTRRAYWAYFFASGAIETTTRSRVLLRQFRDVADAQFRAGRRSQQDVLRAAAELGSLDAELLVLVQRRESASAMLRMLIDAPDSQSLPEPAAGEIELIVAKRDVLLAQAARMNPALRRVSDRLAQFEQRQRLANLNRWPDLTVSLSYNVVESSGLSPVADGSDQWWLGLGINLPIWGEKYDAAEREAVFGRLEAASELAGERNRVAFEVEDALLSLESQRGVLELLREQILPDASAAVEASASAYQTGAGDFLALVDNWRKLLSYEVMEYRVIASVERALADLRQAVGGELSPSEPSGSGTDDTTPPNSATEEVKR